MLRLSVIAPRTTLFRRMCGRHGRWKRGPRAMPVHHPGPPSTFEPAAITWILTSSWPFDRRWDATEEARLRGAQPGDLPVFSRLRLVCQPRGVRFVSGHLRDLGLGESDGEQQTRDEPTGNGFDGRLWCLRLDSRPPMDNLPETPFCDSELIAKDPMEEVVADLSVFVVRDLGPQASTVWKVPKIAPMIARPSATPGEVRLLRPAVVCDVPTQFPERRQRIRRW